MGTYIQENAVQRDILHRPAEYRDATDIKIAGRKPPGFTLKKLRMVLDIIIVITESSSQVHHCQHQHQHQLQHQADANVHFVQNEQK